MNIKHIFLFLCLFTVVFNAHTQANQLVNIDIPNSKPINTITVAPNKQQPFVSFWLETSTNQQTIWYKTKTKKWSKWQQLKADAHHNHQNNKHYFVPTEVPNTTTKIKLKFPEKTSAKLTLFYPNTSKSKTPTSQAPNAKSQTRTLTDSCFCPLPAVQYRNDWCPSGNCPMQSNPTPTNTTNLIVHHSAGSNSSTDWAATVRSIWNFHVNTRGWADIGYNYLIDPNGVIYEGRGEDIVGAHFSCMNTNAMGICLLGDFTNTPPTQAAMNALQTLSAWKLCKLNESATDSTYHNLAQMILPNIAGHRDGNNAANSCTTTSCPGNELYNQLISFRNQTLVYQETCNTGSPDIVISALSYTPANGGNTAYVGQPINLNVTFGNSGSANITDSVLFTHRIGLNNPIDTDYIDMLNMGQTRSFQYNNYVFNAAGNYQYCVFANGANNEVNTANNSFCVSVPVIDTANCNLSVTISEANCQFNANVTGNSSPVAYQWLLNGNPIAGETQSTYTSQINGAIAVVVSTNLCNDTSNIITANCQPNGINWLENLGINARFNNPIISIKNEHKQALNYRVFNLLGQTITTGNTKAARTKINLNQQPKGLYVLQLSANGVSVSKKFVVQ